MGAVAIALSLAASSCDNSFIFEQEGDCSPRVQFIFKKHRQALHSLDGRASDAFYSAVGSVHLFVYDAESGELVFEKAENTENLSSASDLRIGSGTDRCFMPVDLQPGTYRFVAWCGLDETGHNNAFMLQEDDSSESRGSLAPRYGHCRVKLATPGFPVHDEKYDALYHGVAGKVTVGDEGNQIIPIELTKDTNEISVWVQHATHTFSEGEYEVVYADANGMMHFEDNSMKSPERLEYKPHTTSLLTSETEYNGSTVEAGALVAHISTSRLMDANSRDARLEVRNREGKTVFSIPFIKYVTQMQTFTSDAQYYLDCEDTYNCSFYLTGEEGAWMPARIIINHWVIVPDQNSEL